MSALGCLVVSVALLVLGALGLVFFVTGTVLKLVFIGIALVLAVVGRLLFFWWH